MQAVLIEKAKEIGLELDKSIACKLLDFSSMLLQENKKFNLTAIVEPYEVLIKHLIDSLSASRLIPQGAAVVDIGSGAGLPGLPIAIARADCKVTLIDSLAKRVNFMAKVAAELGLDNVVCLHRRAEDIGLLRESYDIGLARAVASLPVLIEYVVPYLKVGGRLIAYKSEAEEEIAGSGNALAELNCIVESKKQFLLDNVYKRCLIVIKKLDKTALKYPRSAGRAKARPL